MDLFKAIDFIPHDFIIANLSTYETQKENLRLIYYLKVESKM